MVALVHEYPTRLFLGAGSLCDAISRVGSKRAALVNDHALESVANTVFDAHWLRRRVRDVSYNEAASVAEWLLENEIELLVAMGGGTTIDLAKVASLIAANQGSGVGQRMLRLGERAGALTVQGQSATRCRVWAAPSTFGTGAEVNAVASLKLDLDSHSFCSRRILLTGSCLRPDLAILDPGLTRTLSSGQQASGLLEVFVRLVGSECGSECSLPLARRESIFLTGEVASLLDRCAESDGLNDNERLHAAMLSSQSHLGWSLYGRGSAPSPLWMVANEVATAAGCSKMEATCWLLPSWIALVVEKKRVWGDSERCRSHSVLADRGMLSEDGVRRQLRAWRVDPALESRFAFSVADLATLIIERWGDGLPFMRHFQVSDIMTLLERASG